ncbi:septum site-determining protein MinC [Candidatus Viridilinea mediisalina]|uniref:Probable septum site-determining protein MinC n=1 Tax=Candidatus Viridilinea mediisalina TaxID=2024553 RepID=A0A2A6RG35_9CHLR|nr:septum site-determining protein MinC [Candidatus Viridilinea mediisalina]PDW01891.1 septum site-determining protein MinC [Candidatus Viridilinea mediisalina]
MSDLMSIKGGRDGLRIRFDDSAEWGLLLEQLEQQLNQNQAFFNGASLALDVGERTLTTEQLTHLLNLLQHHGVVAEALSAGARETRNAARTAGVTARPLPRYPDSSPQVSPDAEALLLIRTVRSGQVLRHSGHITLIGDVNPGGELIAGGSVVVWGRLRGFVHAGALGNVDAIVCAMELRPTQIRIAEQFATTPQEAGPHRPEVARIAGAQIVVESWEAFKK